MEDHAATRREMVEAFSGAAARVKLVGAYPDAESLLRAGVLANVAVVLVDLGLPGMSGAECIRTLTERAPHARTVALTAFDDEANLFSALQAGAHGYRRG